MSQNTLKTEPRDTELSKGDLNKFRKAGRIPASLYGKGIDTELLFIDLTAFQKMLVENGQIFEMETGGEKHMVKTQEEEQYCYATIIQGLDRSGMSAYDRSEICNQMEEPFLKLCIEGKVPNVSGSGGLQDQPRDINQDGNFQSFSFLQQESVLRGKAEIQGARYAYEFLKNAFQETPPPEIHNLAHVIGEYAYNEGGLSGIGLCGQDFLFGCYHGFFIELVIHEGSGVLQKSKEACASLPHGSYLPCIHGVGHGVFDYEGNLMRSLEQCTFFTKEDEFYCQTGVFMANVMDLTFFKEGEVTLEICKEVEEKFKPACYVEQSVGVYLGNRNDLTASLRACKEVTQEHYRSLCFRGISRFVVSRKDDTFGMIEQCRLFTPGGFDGCIETVVRQLILSQRRKEAGELCSYLKEEEHSFCQEEIRKTQEAFL